MDQKAVRMTPFLSHTGSVRHFLHSSALFLSSLALGTSRLALHLSRMANADPRFNEFILFQAQNAGLFLGQIPHPANGERTVNLRAAKSVIDSLEMLADKTAGNLTETEEKLLTTALANLRPLYDKAAG
jgi:hypothetical protein